MASIAGRDNVPEARPRPFSRDRPGRVPSRLLESMDMNFARSFTSTLPLFFFAACTGGSETSETRGGQRRDP